MRVPVWKAGRRVAVVSPTPSVERSTSVVRRKPVLASMASLRALTRRTMAWRYVRATGAPRPCLPVPALSGAMRSSR